jgi:hypothetical protein
VIADQQKRISAPDFIPHVEGDDSRNGFGPQSAPVEWAAGVADLVPLVVMGEKMKALILWPDLLNNLRILRILNISLNKIKKVKVDVERELITKIEKLEKIELKGVRESEQLTESTRTWDEDKRILQAKHKTIVGLQNLYEPNCWDIVDQILGILDPIILRAQDGKSIEDEATRVDLESAESFHQHAFILEGNEWTLEMGKGIGNDNAVWGDDKEEREKRRLELLTEEAENVLCS